MPSLERRARIGITLGIVSIVLSVFAIASLVFAPDDPPMPQTNTPAQAVWQALTPEDQQAVCEYANGTRDPWGDVDFSGGITRDEWEVFIAFACS